MISSGTEIQPSDRQAWLAERRTGLGASEAAAALGVSPFETPLGLWARKVGVLPEVLETEAMEIGTLMEPMLAELYTRRTGRTIGLRQQFLRGEFRGVPLFATLDAVDERFYPVEFKCLSAWKAGQVGEEGTDDLPAHWLCQASQQLYLLGAPRIDFAILVGGNRFIIRTIERNDTLIEAMLAGLRAFWRCVETRAAPRATERDAGVLAALYPVAEGEVDLGEVAWAQADAYEGLGADIRGLQAQRDRAKVGLLEALGNHAVGVLPDGRRVKKVVVAPHRVEGYEVKGSTYPRILKAKERA